MRRFEVALSVVALALVFGCGGKSPAEQGPRPDPRVITREQMLERHYVTAMDAVQALKANWITPRGPDSFVVPSQLWVYFDNVRLGNANSLRTINTRDISYLQYFNGIEATSRYGIGHGAGVILAVSWPGGESLEREPDDSSVAESSSVVAPGAARFDWFTYEGDDSVYRSAAVDQQHYVNPVLAGFYPDPSVTRVGEDYYLVVSSFAYFPGVPIFRSRDLVSWTQIGSVLDRPSQLALDSAGISRGIFAPVIRHHAGRFYMLTTLIDKGGTFYVTATNPAGPWSDPVWLSSVEGIDPSFFFDDDGKAYVVYNSAPIGAPLYNGHRAIWIQEFDVASGQMTGPRSMIVNGGVDLSKKPIWIEAPHILKRGGKYYLICAEGGTGYNHSEVVFRSDAATGPYVPGPSNPILTQRHLDPARPNPITTTGHADFVQTPAGDWWAVFLGTRPYGDDTYNTGRETFLLPVRWENDWPVMLSGTAVVPYLADRPALPPQPAPAIPTSGNFRIRDEFNGPTLAPYWEMIRTPHTRWYDFTTSPGSLTLQARHAGFDVASQPSFVGRRQQHLIASASTAMRYVPTVDGDKAGLVAFQNDQYYYFLSVARIGGSTFIRLEKHAGAATAPDDGVVASVPVNVSASRPVYLKIQAGGGRYDFYYGSREGDWTLLAGDADGTILSTKVAGGFVGTLLGLYAFSAAP
ncbi:MAG: glycoside hydrolase family 43 protein [bacterium]